MAKLKPARDNSPIREAMFIADIARLMGNQAWRYVFVKLADKTDDSELRSTLMDLSICCNETLLDVAYNNMR